MNRTQARAAAMKMLYEWDMGGDGGEDTLSGMLEIEPGEEEYGYMDALVNGVKQNVDEIDGRIEKFAVGWKKDRLAKVDLAILRLGAYELWRGEIPGPVAISEAVERSRVYSTEKAGPFINGVLGNIMRALKR